MTSLIVSHKATKRLFFQLPPSLRRTCFSTSASVSSAPEVYDIVCVGGGPVGLSLLSALRSTPSTQPLKIALIDSQDLSTSRVAPSSQSYSNRCSSLTPKSVRFLKKSGAWAKIRGARSQDYHGMEVWDGVSGARISFDPLDAQDNAGAGILDAMAELVPRSRFRESRRRDGQVGNPTVVATMCENQNLTSTLLDHLLEESKVEILDKTKVESIDLGPVPQDQEDLDLSQWPLVTLPNSRQLAARLLVGADGANSPVRNFADIKSEGWDYNQHGIVATLELDHTFVEGDPRVAYQRFLPTGPIALLPLPGNKASLVWSITADLATKIKSLQPEAFANMINAAFRLQTADLSYLIAHTENVDIADELAWRLPNTLPSSTGLPSSIPQVVGLQAGSVASFPLRMRHATTYTGHRVALIGDAAHTIHPLAGQGLNLGLADAESLANQVIFGMDHGMDIGTAWCLDGYTSDRWAKNNAVMGVCDKLQKLYGVDAGPVVWARTLGVEALQRIEPLKGMIMRAAGTG